MGLELFDKVRGRRERGRESCKEAIRYVIRMKRQDFTMRAAAAVHIRFHCAAWPSSMIFKRETRQPAAAQFVISSSLFFLSKGV